MEKEEVPNVLTLSDNIIWIYKPGTMINLEVLLVCGEIKWW